MEPIYIFTFAGSFAMGAALCARQVSHDVLTENKAAIEAGTAQDDVEKVPVSVPALYLAAGNVAAIALIVTLVYGWQTLAWWIPLVFLVVSFPAIHQVLLRKILKPKMGSLIYAGLSIIGLIPMIQGWLA
jgi:hypothetical protein